MPSENNNVVKFSRVFYGTLFYIKLFDDIQNLVTMEIRLFNEKKKNYKHSKEKK